MKNINSALIEELYFQFLQDNDSVNPEWQNYFRTDKEFLKSLSIDCRPSELTKTENKPNTLNKIDGEHVQLGAIQSKIADNMELSLSVPTATSFRNIPVKALDENRRIINKYLLKEKRSKISFTHILAWAIVRALVKFPNLNDAFEQIEGKYYRIKRDSVNLGIATDITKTDGSRILVVPNIKSACTLNFSDFIEQYDLIIRKAKANKLELDDFSGTTVTLTNPGMIGTTSSMPRLMHGQSLIIAAGNIGFPAEFQAVNPEMLSSMAISKVITLTNTYDHRIIQGAESAEFLSYVNSLLLGDKFFYDQIFAALKIPFEPVRWTVDRRDKKNENILDNRDLLEKGAHVMLMINAYRVRGHLLASTNPLGLFAVNYPELDPAYYGFTIWDLDRSFHTDDDWDNNEMPLRDVIELLRDTYCGSIGIEYMHIVDTEIKEWIKSKAENTRSQPHFNKTEKIQILKKLLDAEEFENFLHTKFVGHKRFSLEGGESLILIIDKLFNLAADAELPFSVIGMSHRGRLNVLKNNFHKSLEMIFDEFDGNALESMLQGSTGDVKYHLGNEAVFISENNKKLNIYLSPNPSHLELVDPVIEGMARALDNSIDDKTYTKTLPILVHGDAAFAGQGIVAETLNLSQLEGYKTGGTIHVIVNNQIGFTTTSENSRSTFYATEVGKMVHCPIIHVNGNDPEAVVAVAKFAFEFRQKFNSDIVIDMLCYRKYGHNESDEPSYTQPLLYKKIKQMKPIGVIYKEQLIKEQVMTEDEFTGIIRRDQQELYDVFSHRNHPEENTQNEKKYQLGDIFKPVNTSLDYNLLLNIGNAITNVPENIDFHINPKVKTLLKRRYDMVHSERPAIDWSMAEALAFGTILCEGTEIRFSGQDSRRGTFSQRHSTLTDIENEEIYIPLNNIQEHQALLRIWDSPLSEVAVLGYEYGYSLKSKNALTVWEAQFGDFANNAQTMYDQYISCAESKWGQTSNIISLLPHSYDGQGPEHSSARLERYLQLCADENMIVANLTSPAQYYHILRRQSKLQNKKPLILMTPKSMLRNHRAVSSLKELAESAFYEIIDHKLTDPDSVEKIIFCSGKIYWELIDYIDHENINNVNILTIEQISPFNREQLAALLSGYSNANSYVWLQEEPKNQGAWAYVKEYIEDEINQKLKYAGRKAAAATATGLSSIHEKEQKEIIESVFKL